ncbi:SH3 domain-containing protein [Reyranella sp. CPCC 100927]|uniref:SH3 domain-containing protein n=1 Tax=Reyranella sp. CPCC 100927 TaxID=2599616 RepID=UPI0015B3AA8C|nr:SH3 domain-containing protein [Reyranella sp. CPCC 100927]
MRYRPFPIALISCVLAAVAASAPVPAVAQGTNPERWTVSGVSAGKTLTVRDQPSSAGEPVGTVPHDARGLVNLGCRGETPRQRWCRIRYKSVEGWVSGRFLKADAEATAPAATAVPLPQSSSPPPSPPPTEAGSLAFTCTAAGAVIVKVEPDGAVTHQSYPPRETMQVTITVKPSAPESAGPVAPAMIWQMMGPQGERFGGTLAWGKAVDARDGQWHLDLQTKTLRLAQLQEGTAARFFRFDCQ